MADYRFGGCHQSGYHIQFGRSHVQSVPSVFFQKKITDHGFEAQTVSWVCNCWLFAAIATGSDYSWSLNFIKATTSNLAGGLEPTWIILSAFPSWDAEFEPPTDDQTGGDQFSVLFVARRWFLKGRVLFLSFILLSYTTFMLVSHVCWSSESVLHFIRHSPAFTSMRNVFSLWFTIIKHVSCIPCHTGKYWRAA